MRLSFQVTSERLARLKIEKLFLKLEPTEQNTVISCLESQSDAKVYMNRDAFEEAVAKTLKRRGMKVSAATMKTILSALSARDEKADICRDKDGNAEPDAELRDFDLVPLEEDWKSYFGREVAPFVSDAWVDQTYRDERDGKVGRIGYEVNFNRCFYKYVPPRPLSEIDGELKQLETEIAGLLKEIAG